MRRSSDGVKVVQVLVKGTPRATPEEQVFARRRRRDLIFFFFCSYTRFNRPIEMLRMYSCKKYFIGSYVDTTKGRCLNNDFGGFFLFFVFVVGIANNCGIRTPISGVSTILNILMYIV